jgi:DnaJ homolog subfamily B member 6
MFYKVYDLHGVWPPPETPGTPPPRRNRHHNSGHPDPFFDFHSNFHGPGMRAFGAGGSSMPRHNPFTDPFVLFNSLFGDFNGYMHEPFVQFPHGEARGRGRAHHDGFERADMFGPGGPGPMPAFNPTAGMGMFGGMGPSGGMPQRFRTESSFRSTGGRHGFRRESRVTTTVNGVTQSTWTRVDLDVSL